MYTECTLCVIFIVLLGSACDDHVGYGVCCCMHGIWLYVCAVDANSQACIGLLAVHVLDASDLMYYM